MKARGNSFPLKLRDKFFPSFTLRVETGDGPIPFVKGDLVGQDLWIKGDFENADRAFLRDYLTRFSRFIDVGANSGIYTLLASRHLAPGGQVFAFEASPREFKKLQRTIAWNRLRNVTAENLAVGEHPGEVPIYQSLSGSGALNRVGRPAKPTGEWEAVPIQCVALDDYFARIPEAPTLLKIDVEGYELPVLKGAFNLLQSERPVVMVEIVTATANEESSPLSVFEFLELLGYRWHFTGLKPCSRTDFEQRLRDAKTKGYESRNLFAIPT